MKKLLPLFVIVIFTLGCEGPTGPKGRDGNANVKSSEWTVPNSAWTFSNDGYYAVLEESNVTQDIVDDGAVMVYTRFTETEWVPLPYIIFGSTYDTRISAIHGVGYVHIIRRNSNNTTDTPGSTTYYKVVTIASLGKSSANVNWNDYNAVKQKFNLSD